MNKSLHAVVVPFMFFALALFSVVFTADGAQKPNILIIVGDDMGYADVGFHGCKDIPTPNLDALAKSGVYFTDGYVSGPYCSPTRAGLLTGRYQTRFGHEFNPAGTQEGLPPSETTLADVLRTAGYTTGLVGKWHLGSLQELHPQRRGFDEFYGFLGGAHGYFNAGNILRGTTEVESMDYTTDAFGREGVAFIEQHKGEKPWFLYLAFNAVHTPMHATDKKMETFSAIENRGRRTYASMMSSMDDAIGQVIETLKKTGQYNNTLVAFISDNGGPVMRGTTTNFSSNAPLRGSKRTTLEGGIRVPFIVSFPGVIKPHVYRKPVIQLDITATAIAVAGTSKPDIEGVDLLPYLEGKNQAPPHDALYWRFGTQQAIRAGDWKLVRYDLNVDNEKGTSAFCLFNLAEDIGEQNNLAEKMPEKVKELQDKWNEWNKTNKDPLFGGNNVGMQSPGDAIELVDDDGPEPGRTEAFARK